jgi:inner membrane protein
MDADGTHANGIFLKNRRRIAGCVAFFRQRFESKRYDRIYRTEVDLATALSHAVAALSIGTCFHRHRIPTRVWIAGAACSVIPDLDVIGFRFGIRYGDFWGHRGFTHSLVFAAAITGIAMIVAFRREIPALGRFSLIAYLFLATASHGLLDAMTNGGLGVAFFSPFDNDRYFLPWRPVQVSPISLGRLFGIRAQAIITSELLWIWVPAGLLAVLALTLRHSNADRKAEMPELKQG